MASADQLKDENLFTDDEFRNYFRINLEYNKNGWMWTKEAIFHFSLTIEQNSSEGKELMTYLKNKHIFPEVTIGTDRLQGKLKNEPNGRHVEAILLDGLKSRLNKFKTERKDEKDKETTSTNLKSQDIVHQLSQMKISNKDEPVNQVNLSLEILLNYSPCAICARNIVEFREEIKKIFDIHIIIRFGSFYKFDKETNQTGLKLLTSRGIVLDLIWGYMPLQSQIKQTGTDEQRTKREEQDQRYMELVNNTE